MPYVERIEGVVSALYAVTQEGYAEEFLPDDDPEVVSFRSNSKEIIPAPALYAIADIYISDLSISFLTISAKISAVFYIDVGTYWVFFAETQPNTNYIPLCYNHNHTVFVSEKNEDFFVVTALSGGLPSDPTSLSVEVKRVQ